MSACASQAHELFRFPAKTTIRGARNGKQSLKLAFNRTEVATFIMCLQEFRFEFTAIEPDVLVQPLKEGIVHGVCSIRGGRVGQVNSDSA